MPLDPSKVALMAARHRLRQAPPWGRPCGRNLPEEELILLAREVVATLTAEEKAMLILDRDADVSAVSPETLARWWPWPLLAAEPPLACHMDLYV